MTESPEILRYATQDNTGTYLTKGHCCIGYPFFTYMNKVIAIGKRVPFQMHHLYLLDEDLHFDVNYPKFRIFRAQKLKENPQAS